MIYKKVLCCLLFGFCVVSDLSATGAKTAGDVQCQCWAVTQSGARCKRRARPGARYCKQHSADVTPKKAPERCRSMTENGGQCSEKPVPGKNYCEKHLKSEHQAGKPH